MEQLNALDRYALMLNLSDEEQTVYEQLDAPGQELFQLYRQSFALTMGNEALMIWFFNAYFANATEEYKEFLKPTLVRSDHTNPPGSLLAIRAPSNHVSSGKINRPDSAVEAIKSGWSSLFHSISNMYFNPSNTLQSFIDQFCTADQTFIIGKRDMPRSDDSIIQINVGRLTTTDVRASFLREIILNSARHSLFIPGIQTFLEKCKELVMPFVTATQQVIDIADQFEAQVSERAVIDLAALVDISPEEMKNRINTNEIWENEYKGRKALVERVSYRDVVKTLLPQFPEDLLLLGNLTTLKNIQELMTAWEDRHKGQKFLTQD